MRPAYSLCHPPIPCSLYKKLNRNMEVLLQLPQNSQKRTGFCIIGPTLQELCIQVHVIDYRELCSTDSSIITNQSKFTIKTRCPLFSQNTSEYTQFPRRATNYSQRLGALTATEARRMGVLVKTILFIFKFISFVLLAYE